MSSSRRVSVSASAERDIRDILQYTLETWGERQHRTYAAQLATGIERIAAFSGIGHEIHARRPEVRGFRVRHHTIVFRADAESVTILRVAHERMDLARLDLDDDS